MSDRDALLRAAVAAATELYPEESRRLESQLVGAVERNLDGALKREYRSDDVLGWQRQPGGVDLAILDDGRARTVMEMKLDDLDQSLWDIFKLASLLRHPRIHEAFLVYEAARSSFEGQMDCASLFRADETERVETVELIRRWPKAWAWLLEGGYWNYPQEAVQHLLLTLRGTFPLAADPAHEVRVLEVAMAGQERVPFDEEGWPEAIPIAQRVVRRPKPEKPGPQANATLSQTPMELPNRITQAWLDSHVPRMSEQDFGSLLETLRSKRWNAKELDERVFPLRPADTPEPTKSVTPVGGDEADVARIASSVAEEAARQVSPGPTPVDLPSLIQRVLPAVVQVVATKRKQISTGSGFAMTPIKGDEDTAIFVTNAHVTTPGDQFSVRWGEDAFYRADLLLEDPDNDIALLEVPIRPPATLPVRYLRDVKVGESVIAIGSPLGWLTQTVTPGIVSAWAEGFRPS